MRVLMFGWEFPPFNAGGLGTACHGLTRGLVKQDIDVSFVIPKAGEEFDATKTHVNLLVADQMDYGEHQSRLSIRMVDSVLVEYVDSASYDEKVSEWIHRYWKIEQKKNTGSGAIYGKNLIDEVHRYAEKARLIAMTETHDIIHAHDWMTYLAGKNAKQVSGKPLVVHIHATEFDRTAGHPNQSIYDLEREGFHAADKIVAVSNLTKNVVVKHYGVPPEKVVVVHNGVEFNDASPDVPRKGKTVLYLGRITIQKGPEYFLGAAKKVLDYDPDVTFIMAGNGDMEQFIINKAAELGISKNVLFTGFLRGADIDKAYRMADLYVMPSVSEPFGITPLEAMRNDTPCIISKTSGVSEVVNHCLKVDFWDIDMMSNMMLASLNYRSLHKSLRDNGREEVNRCSWEAAASKCISVYRDVLDSRS